MRQVWWLYKSDTLLLGQRHEGWLQQLHLTDTMLLNQ
jgi:hypothetical protein